MSADFMAQTDYESDYMDVSDHAGSATTTNQGLSTGSPTRSLLMAWGVAWAVWWLLHFLFKGQLG